MAHFNHVVPPGAVDVVGSHRRSASRTPRKRGPLNRLLGNPTIGNHPGMLVFMRVCALYQGRLKKFLAEIEVVADYASENIVV